jgi:hypothetical protein
VSLADKFRALGLAEIATKRIAKMYKCPDTEAEPTINAIAEVIKTMGEIGDEELRLYLWMAYYLGFDTACTRAAKLLKGEQ